MASVPAPPKEYQMTKEEKLKERIEGYEEEKKELNVKIRKVKAELRWLKIKNKVQNKKKMGNNVHNNNKKYKKLLRWE